MTTYLSNYNSYTYQTSYTDQYNGVVYISDGTYAGTGSLLYDGRTILTAAHVVEGAPLGRITVYFDTAMGMQSLTGDITIHEDYDAFNSNNDVAIITLDENAFLGYNRYELYRESDEIAQDFTMVGYGNVGSGAMGEYESFYDTLKMKTKKTVEADFYEIYLQDNLPWIPLEDSILVADFDDGSMQHDALGGLLGIYDPGLGRYEGMIKLQELLLIVLHYSLMISIMMLIAVSARLELGRG